MKKTRISQTIVLMVMIILAGLATANAQNVLPDAQNQACWQDLNSLRQCVATQQQQLADEAARCTSYPEYQCAEPENAREVPAKKVTQQKARVKKQDIKVEKTATAAVGEARRGQ
ncbi:MAG TPA: hypothetical protein VKH18_03110 [Terriglobales bacterium]|nr:hypothetical protein [Terriglobales bacterium]